MKLQYLAVIFIIIVLPITLVLSFYLQTNIDVINLQASYKAKLNNATYDAVKAFQLNTTNSYYSSVSDSKIRDIEASVNTFYNSLTANLNYTKSELSAYVPAIVYTLYDGYYIYGKRYNVLDTVRKGELNPDIEGEEKDIITKVNIATDTETNTDPDKYEYGLKPYVYYSCRYKDKDKNNDFIVNFTLDNFISIYGTVKGEYVTKSGYLININDYNEEKSIYKDAKIPESEIVTEYLKFSGGQSQGLSDGEYSYVIYQGQKIYAKGNRRFWYDKGTAKIVNSEEILKDKDVKTGWITSATEYYKKSHEFSKWVTDNLGTIKQEHIQAINENSEIKAGGANLSFNAGDSDIFNMEKQNPQDASSTFNQHRIAVIKNTIETNLIAAINSYNSNAGSYAYAMPKLSEDEWEKVVNNVCVIAFMQGMPIGAKYFNDYVVIPNDKNNEFVEVDNIYLLTNDGQYHTVNCPDLVEDEDYQNKILDFSRGTGYINTSFEKQTLDENYYYKHIYQKDSQIYPYTACYHCIVNASGKYDIEDIINGNNKNENNKLIQYNLDGEQVATYDITTLRSIYLTALAREKYNLYKTSNYYIEDTSNLQ